MTQPCKAILQEMPMLCPGTILLLLPWLKQSWEGESEMISRPPSDGGQPGSEVEGSAARSTDASHGFWVLSQWKVPSTTSCCLRTFLLRFKH